MMKKSLIIATAMIASVVGMQTQQAEAKVRFDVHIGGYGGGYWGGGYGGHGGHGGYGHGHGGYGNGGYGYNRRISCYRGKRIVRNQGYRFVRAIDCRGSVYKFKARRWGQTYILKMKSRNGRVFSRRHI